jgi:gas vesicle protein
MKTLRTIFRAFVFGALAGLLIAPRSGRETRDMLVERWNSFLDGTSGMNFDDAKPSQEGGTQA